MQYASFVAASSVMQRMQPHPLANFFEAKLNRFGQYQNLASPKNLISYSYAEGSFIPR